MLVYCKKYLAEWNLFIYKSVLITNPTGFVRAFTNVEATLKQCRDKVVSDNDVVSTLCNVENPTSDFVPISMSDQHYFNVDPQRQDSQLSCCGKFLKNSEKIRAR